MSALGQKRTFAAQQLMSALPPKADAAARHQYAAITDAQDHDYAGTSALAFMTRQNALTWK
jgi:hypothetical protein